MPEDREPVLILVDEFIAMIRRSGVTQVEALSALSAVCALMPALEGISFSNASPEQVPITS
jgi:hypothetical protein